MSQSQPAGAAPNAENQPSGFNTGYDAEIRELQKQAQQGNLDGLRAYLTRTRIEKDWQDRMYVLEAVAPGIRLEILNFACDLEPEAADLFLIRCVYFSSLALTNRGSGTCDQVAEGSMNQAAICIKKMLVDLEKVSQLDPEDPTPHVCALRPLNIFGQLGPMLQSTFHKAISLAPGLVPAHYRLVTTLSKRWYGKSHEDSLQFARFSLTKAIPGSDMAACLFSAHSLVRTHLIHFDKNMEGARAYAHNPDVTQELNAAYDSWIKPPYKPCRSSLVHLHQAACWFYLKQDRERLASAFSLVGDNFFSGPWRALGNAQAVHARARSFADGKTLASPPPATEDLLQRCLEFVSHGINAMDGGKVQDAEKAFLATQVIVQAARSEEIDHISPLALLCLSLLRQKQQKDQESLQLRRKATAQLDDAAEAPTTSAKYHRLMAQTLYRLKEYRRSLPFWDQAIRFADNTTAPPILATMLHTMGACYCLIGLRDHGAVPLRVALKIFRSAGPDSALAAVLISLGNALAKRSPAEAEACYKEAADIHIASLQYEAASTAWINLGVLYSRLDRNRESLEYYQKALHARQQMRDTKPARIALALNNVACGYRRMGQYADAHASVDRAIPLFPPEDPGLAGAYGTRGEIYLDMGDYSQAVKWLQLSRATREKQPSPNLEQIAEYLEKEVTALEKLGKTDEASAAKQHLESINATAQSVPQANNPQDSDLLRIEGLVQIELEIGSKNPHPDAHKNLKNLAEDISETVRTQNLGTYSGSIETPEQTTLICYGPDAETLFHAIESTLKSNPLCAGARVLVQQQDKRREALIAIKSNSVN